ncbi:phosphotransferase enzyme family protein [Methylomarinum vadi]|uniref:phosphotransferase enzyme family protein n=1 Tax=Methylomarinum vadi TaxID=438855 RepID=UPI0004DF1136|nr:aminoglycoside phosphotransferase family protein [Methylomarinum vadi]
MNERLTDIARQFSGNRRITNLAPLGNGLINDTFLVTAEDFHFVLQCINEQVFPKPVQVMENLQQLTRHVQAKQQTAVCLQIPALLKTTSANSFHIDPIGRYWRAWQLVEKSESRENISRITEAEQAGFALGHFHRLVSDLAPETLHDTLPGFHITPNYLRTYHRISVQSTVRCELDEFAYCRHVIAAYKEKAGVLEQARQHGRLRERIIHGDPKLNNFLFAENSDRIVSLIDLDTVKPGLVHYDIGDCLRSCCHRKQDNRFDLEVCAAILRHYLAEAGHFFDRADYDYLYAAIELIPFELGLRFFTDFLNGDRYFKTSQPTQNLLRAAEQFRLCEDIRRQRRTIEDIIRQLAACQSIRS